MGVTGLWRLIEPAGKPVPVETLENKVLAVDISIWLHQMVKGYQDAKGAPLPNAHLMGLFQRLCKLLYFRIKPVFVFDGGFPELKRETIAKRQDHKTKYNSESERLKRELALVLCKKTAVSSLLGKQTSPRQGNNSNNAGDDDIFKLPALPQKDHESESESDDEKSPNGPVIDLHSVDIKSDKFKNLTVKEKYELLVELKETRKMNSWGKLHELPRESDHFSDFQMQRLLKRRKVQECLEETEREMGDGGMSLNDLESLLNEEGIDTKIDSLPTRRIASSNTTRFLLINNVKKALAEAKMKSKEQNAPSTSKTIQDIQIAEKNEPKTDELEEDLEKAIKMSLECVGDDKTISSKKDELEEDIEKAIQMSLQCNNEADEAINNSYNSKTDDSWTSVMTDSDYTDSEDNDGFEHPSISSAKAYIMQYTDFTHKTIDKIVASKHRVKSKTKIPAINEILEELNQEKSVIVDNIEISSSDTDYNQDNADACHKQNVSQDIVELSTSEDFEIDNNNEGADTTQSSVVCINDPIQDVVQLDTSNEDNDQPEGNMTQKPNEETSSDSDDDEFEDVPEVNNKSANTVVELLLNLDDVPDEDIFADVFENTQGHVSKILTGQDNCKDLRNVASKQQDQHFEFTNTEKKDMFHEQVTAKNEDLRSNKVDLNTQVDNQEHVIIKQNTEILSTDNSCKYTDFSNVNAIETDQNEVIINNEFTKPPADPISTEMLNSIVDKLQNEEQDLVHEKGRLDRIGRNITEQMTKEAQELLQIFGIPYIIAPMEAEAQCAYLESVKLTDGTITDDSDIWLFGGRTVYKNFFNQKKHVLQFLAERIERSFNLSREQLVLLALLVGSDYTTGVTGVGPVTALEILASFPFNKKQCLGETSKQGIYEQIITGLQEFKKWVKAGKRTDNTTLKKKLRNVNLTDDFPSVRVIQAYLEPNVEKSEEKFTWGELDVSVLRAYTKTKFGWSQNKLDEIIQPVLKRILNRKNQKSIQEYFKRTIDFQSLEDHMSKRVKAAVQKMGPEAPLEENVTKEKNKPARKRKVTGTQIKNSITTESSKTEQMQSSEELVLNTLCVKVVSEIRDGGSGIQITIPKSDRCYENIPQREKDKQNLLQNKMKAIEIFRKTKLDRKRKVTKKRGIKPKEKAELSESDSD